MTWPQGTGDPYGQQQPGYDPYGQPYSAEPYSGQPSYDMYAQPQPAPYPPPPYQPPVAPYASPTTNGLAIASLVCGIAGLTIAAFIGALLAVIFGHIAKKQIAERGEGGSGMATAGLVTGYIGLGFSVLCGGFYLILIIVAATSSSTSYDDGYTFVTSLGALLGF